MNCKLAQLLANPELCKSWEAQDWDTVIPQARNTSLLSSVGLRLKQYGMQQFVPNEVSRHMDSTTWIHQKQVEGLEYELMWLGRALAEVDEKLILLKGAAYITAQLPPSAGRLISDIDLLVGEDQLSKVEQVLQKYGWESGVQDSYDELYYRKWMHEIPPMAHIERDSVLDVHHTILPPTADEKFDPNKLFEDLREVQPGIYVLSPLDMILHSATHLFHEGEFNRGLRDLLDLDLLLKHYSVSESNFWPRLISRSQEMGMVNSLFLALRYTVKFLSTPVPVWVSEELGAQKPRFPGNRVMDFLFERGFTPNHHSCALPLTGVAEFFLYIRSHYLRMPLYLLFPHLMRKAWKGSTAATGDNNPDEVKQG